MRQGNKPRRSVITSFCVRFNKEVAPFQYIRVEITASVSRDTDPDDARAELIERAEELYHDIKEKIYNINPIDDQIPGAEVYANNPTNRR